MIRPAQRNETAFFLPPRRLPELHGHLHGHFHSHGAGIGKKEMLKPLREKVEQPPSEFHGRFMRKSAEHDVRKLRRLTLHGAHELFISVAVHPAPPRGHAVHESRSVAQQNART